MAPRHCPCYTFAAMNMNSFTHFLLPAQLEKAIVRMGFQTPTPVQAKTIPLALENRDIISLAETGSGKTAAYLIPVLSSIIKKNARVLILAPTRELANQIVEVAKELMHFLPDVSGSLIIGGVPMKRQIAQLRQNPDIIIATPGRLIDHCRQKTIRLSDISTLVLDEADRMFDMGFAPQVKNILREIPNVKQTMLFSATFPKEIKELANSILKNPAEVTLTTKKIMPNKINQKAIEITIENKNDKTLDLINEASGSVLIFTRTKHRTDKLTHYLSEYGVKVARLHSNRTQGQRYQAIEGFKAGRFRVLVATDIAARGIDVTSVSDVINYDLPENFEDYIHRIGRTGRAGREGQALTLVTLQDRYKWALIARKIGLADAPSVPNRFSKKQFHRREKWKKNRRQMRARPHLTGRNEK